MKVVDDFKKFIKRGNVIDMAVGVVIGVAFGAISKSLVDDVIMPPLGILTGDMDFSNKFWVIQMGEPAGPYATLAQAKAAGAVAIAYGNFINTIVNFLIVALAMFLVVRVIQRMTERADETPADTEQKIVKPVDKQCPYCFTDIPFEAIRCPNCTSELDPPPAEAI